LPGKLKEMTDINLPKNPETCPNCYLGRISRQTRSMVVMHNGKPLTFTAFPAWACDVCHAFVYDPQALIELRLLLGANNLNSVESKAGKRAVKRRKMNKTRKAKTVDPK